MICVLKEAEEGTAQSAGGPALQGGRQRWESFSHRPGTPGTTSGGKRQGSFPPEPAEGACLCQHLGSVFLVSGTLREYISVVLKPPVSGNFLSWQLQETNTGGNLPSRRAIKEVLLWHSGLRIWHCHYSGSGCCCGVGLIPGLGTSACRGSGQKKKRKNNKEKEPLKQANRAGLVLERRGRGEAG